MRFGRMETGGTTPEPNEGPTVKREGCNLRPDAHRQGVELADIALQWR